jgi:hypothetical protein
MVMGRSKDPDLSKVMQGIVNADRLEDGRISIAFASERYYDDAVRLQKQTEELVGPIEIVHLAILSEGLTLGGQVGNQVVYDVQAPCTDRESS